LDLLFAVEFATLTKSDKGNVVWKMFTPEEIDTLVKATPLEQAEENK